MGIAFVYGILIILVWLTSFCGIILSGKSQLPCHGSLYTVITAAWSNAVLLKFCLQDSEKYVEELLTLFNRFSKLVKEAFNDDPRFLTARDKVCLVQICVVIKGPLPVLVAHLHICFDAYNFIFFYHSHQNVFCNATRRDASRNAGLPETQKHRIPKNKARNSKTRNKSRHHILW